MKRNEEEHNRENSNRTATIKRRKFASFGRT